MNPKPINLSATRAVAHLTPNSTSYVLPIYFSKEWHKLKKRENATPERANERMGKKVITNYTLISFLPVTLINGLIIVAERSCAITTTTTTTLSLLIVQLGILKNERRCGVRASTIFYLWYAHEFQASRWNFPNSHLLLSKHTVCQSFQVNFHWIQK